MFNASGHLKTELETRAAYKAQSRQAAAKAAKAMSTKQKPPSKLDCVHRSDIVEIKSLASPPRGVLDVTSAAIAVLGRRAARGQNEWMFCKKTLGNVDNFIVMLKDFNPRYVTPEDASYARKKLAGHSPDEIKKQSCAAASLAQWAIAALELTAA